MRAGHAIALALLAAAVAACRATDATDAQRSHDPGAGALPNPADGFPADEISADECMIATPAPPETAPTTPPDPWGAAPPEPVLRERDLWPAGSSVVAVGDSLTYGQGSTHPGGDTSYPAVLGRMLGVPAVNRGVPGHQAKDLPDVDYLLVGGKQNRLVVMIGTNDIHNASGATAAETYATLARYVAARQRAGWLVTVSTLPRWLAATPTTDRVAMEYDALIRAGFPNVADVAASPLIGRGAPAGPDLAYYGDEIGHLNDAGYAVLARVVRDARPPKGPAPSVTASMGVARNKSLTAWFRDWLQSSALPQDFERPVTWLNAAEGGASSGGFEAFGRDRPSRVFDAINGRPALRFHGPGTGFYIPRDRRTGNFVRARELVISVVMKVESITGTSTAPYDNDGVFSDSSTRLGLSLKRPNIVTAFTYDGVAWTSRESALALGTPVVISMRLLDGMLGLRVGTNGTWSETPAKNLDSLAGVLRIGTDSTNDKTFDGLIADVVVRKSYCDATMAADDAYFRARYGVR